MYSGLVTGLVWSMDRALVEEYGLQYLIDRADMTFFSCVRMFMPPQVVNPRRVIAAPTEIEEKTPTVSTEDAKKQLLHKLKEFKK